MQILPSSYRIYLGLLFEKPVLNHPESSALTEITTVHFPDAEPNPLETRRHCTSHILIPYFREKILRCRAVGLWVALVGPACDNIGSLQSEATLAYVALDTQ